MIKRIRSIKKTDKINILQQSAKALNRIGDNLYNRLKFLKLRLYKQNGFTLVELLIVITILSIMSLIIAPRISNFFDTKRSNFNILTTIIAKTFDDSYIRERINFLLIHLYSPMSDMEVDQEVFARTNGISIVNRDENGIFRDHPDKLLHYKEFPDSFRIEEVLLSTGETITAGNILLPFYPDGYSDNVILHILVKEEEKWSLRIYKMRKEPEVYPDYINFSNENE